MEHDSANNKLQAEVSRIDRWIRYVATHAWVRSGIFVIAFLETTISPLLPELVVAAVLSYRKDISWKVLSIISALGSATGAAMLYIVGKYLYVTHKIFFDNWIGTTLGGYTESLFAHNTFVSLFLAAFTPLPDRIFAFLSGVFVLSFPVVVIAFFFGRLIRVGIVAYFSYYFGSSARRYILKHTKRVTIIVVILIVLYILLKTQGIL